jgi:hypothetical protein
MGCQDTASRTALLLECQRPFDPDTELEPDESGEAARYGSAWHEGLAAHALGRPVKPKDLADKWEVKEPEARAGLGGHIESAWKHTTAWIKGKNAFGEKFRIVDAEAPLAGDGLNDARPTKLDLETHHYDLEPGEFGGTPDLVLEGDETQTRVVWDYKSGEWGDFADPKTPQMLSLTLLANAQAVTIFHYPRTSLPAIYDEAVPIEARQVFATRRRLAMNRIGDGSLRPGAWCARCPARESCPAQHARLLEKTTALVRVASSGSLALDDDVDLGRFHQMWGQIEKLVKIAKAQIRERVAAGEIIERPDGKVLVLQAVKPYETVSMTSIKEALGEAKAKKEIDRLRRLGVLKTVEPEPHLVAK